MDRDKRRSSEEEAELDKKIAIIREKNAKIVEKAKVVEEERVAFGDQPTERRKSNQMKEKKDDNKNGRKKSAQGKDDAFDREWDKGKTPVEKWRENVPSIENVDRRARGRGKVVGMTGNGMNGGRRGAGRGGGGRLDGRVTRTSNEGEEMTMEMNGGGRRRGGGGGMGGSVVGERRIGNGEGMKIQISNLSSNGDDQPARRRNQRERKPKEEGEGEEIEEPRHKQNDKYVIRQILRRVVDRVVQSEKRDKRIAEREKKEGGKEGEKEEEKRDEEKKEEVKTEDEKKEEEKKELDPAPEVKTEDDEKDEEKNNNNDANQTVATVVALAVEEVAVVQESVVVS
ncbi:hypothetical protein PENTCL1PPCAC_2151 [Pristionchus entomophagus]|uniref:Uncharacterized protein n=1 Tax=Pristionchus entomophagus TaxID=358040 RepID=A0AAV5S9U6_9BILA|nr:hypothetical protein PENTCL1PPCAC_2147 [Pristionchus entomophagus]GMS79976.1 hypothetical protein PENTCL1PPCAC_2151 [Pristionchus entomophagus]